MTFTNGDNLIKAGASNDCITASAGNDTIYGEALLANQVDNLVNAMASFNVPKSGQTTLSEEYQNRLNDIIAVSWS